MMNWMNYSFIVLVVFTIYLLLVKKLSLMGYSTVIINLYVFGVTFVGFLFLAIYRKESLVVPSGILLILLLMGVLAVIGNYFNVKGLHAAPNPGYHLAIAFSRVAIIAIAAIFLFKSEFDILKFIGVIVTVTGIILVSL